LRFTRMCVREGFIKVMAGLEEINETFWAN
jgi:hypothetical protein